VGADDQPPGESAASLALEGYDITALLVATAHALRDLHATPTLGCPFDVSPSALLAEAVDRVGRDVVTAEQFDPPYRRYTPAQLLDLVGRSCPPELDHGRRTLVVGDARLATVRLADGRVTGWAQLERAGAGDPYRDLATMAADLAGTVGPEALGPFIDAYGLDHADVIRLDWHVMADQLLR
jgi:aminoglycoside phosphotransferase